MKPDLVLLAGRWINYKNDINKIKFVVSGLKEHGIDNIVILGPVPQWRTIGIKEAILYWSNNNSYPERLNKLNNEATFDMDRKMSEISNKINVNYISPIKYLCDEDGCEIMPDKKTDNVIYFDHGHFTNAGSEYVVSRIRDELRLYSH